MGKVTNTGIAGLVGNLVFYERDGRQYVRTTPGKNYKKKGEVTPGRQLFGIITRNGSKMVKAAAAYFMFSLKLTAYNHMRAWMRHLYKARNGSPWPLSAQQSGMCQMNGETDLRDIFKPAIVVSDANRIITVTVPALDPLKDIIAPPGIKQVSLKAIAVTSAFNDMGYVSQAAAEYIFPYSEGLLPEKQLVLDTHAATGNIAIVFISLAFETNTAGEFIRNARWQPVAALAMGRIG